jgi:hypothetical protein
LAPLSSTADGHLDGFVDDAGVNVMATGDTGTGVYRDVPGGEDILPAPCLGGMRRLPSQRMGQVDLAMSLSRILLMLCLDPGQVILEHRGERGGKSGEPVLVALARTDGQWLHLIIDVLDPKPDRFHDAQATPVEKFGNQWGGSIQQRDDGGDFFACHDHGDVDLLVGAHGIDVARQSMGEDARVEEHQGIHGLVLSGGHDVSMHCQVGQERLDPGFSGEEVFARPQAVETDASHDPLHRGSLRVHGVVVQTEHLSHVIEEFGVWISRRGGHIIPRGGALRSLITGIGQNCPKTSPISHDQGKMAS